ncbi:PKD domain-containing protein [Candidatus Saccharibacteria bacterium]|nr:PKD domain-containing protein [Candidatus Saccharibacteria bacterium]
MIRFSKLVAALAVLPVLAVASPVLADSPGQLTGGSNTFMVKNLTQSGAYANSISATCNEEVQYSVRLHNAAYGGLTNIVVKANIMSGNMTAVPAEGASQGTTGTATVSLPSNGSIAYVSGSSILHDVNGNVIKTLPDGITTAGVNVGNLPGSTTEFVNFKAKVACPPVEQPVYSCDALHVTSKGNRAYSYTVDATAKNGATITGYTFDFGDSNSVNTTVNNTTHTYAKDGTFTSTATVKFNVGGTQKTAVCSQTVTVSTPTTPTPTPTPTPTTPAAIPNTGAGDVLGIFAGASAAGTAAHAIVSRRKRGL